MDPFKNLQDAWKGQEVSGLPDIENVKKNIRGLRNKLVRKNIIAIVLLSLTILVMIAILFFIDFEFVTTKAAVIGMIVTISGAILFMMRLNNQLYKADRLQHSSKAYLEKLKGFKTEQGQMQHRLAIAYFVIITALLYLYFYEIYIMSATLGIIAYTSATLWILFVWFYLRPKTIAKQEGQINKMIEEVERIQAQL